jgi:hypothetical protein
MHIPVVVVVLRVTGLPTLVLCQGGWGGRTHTGHSHTDLFRKKEFAPPVGMPAYSLFCIACVCECAFVM